MDKLQFYFNKLQIKFYGKYDAHRFSNFKKKENIILNKWIWDFILPLYLNPNLFLLYIRFYNYEYQKSFFIKFVLK